MFRFWALGFWALAFRVYGLRIAARVVGVSQSIPLESLHSALHQLIMVSYSQGPYVTHSCPFLGHSFISLKKLGLGLKLRL